MSEKLNAKIYSLLDSIATRVTELYRKTRQNTDAIATLRDEVRVRVGGFVESAGKQALQVEALQNRVDKTESLAGDLKWDLDKVRVENDKREAAQTLRDQSNVQSLVNLRDSTQKGFDDVRKDVESILKTIQRLNERIGKIESEIKSNSFGLTIATHVSTISNRVTFLEEQLDKNRTAPSTIDQSIVNSKLNAVYDVTGDLEARIQKIEGETELFNRLRRAQHELNLAQEAFLFGPPAEEIGANKAPVLAQGMPQEIRPAFRIDTEFLKKS